MAVLEKEDFWGAKLSKASPKVEFNPEFEDSELSDVDHKLILSQACLGVKASGRNIIEVTAVNFSGEECTHTIVSLRESSFEMCSLNLTFNPPATFKLIEGAGPVHITGSHVQSLTEETMSSEEESDEEVPSLVENTKQQKRPLPASTPKGPPNKVAKVSKESDEEESEEEESDEEEEEEKTLSKKASQKKDKQQESKKLLKIVEKKPKEEKEEEEEEEEEESDEDDDDEEDEEEDEEESDEESDDEEESDEEGEDEVTATLTGNKKQGATKKSISNGVTSHKVGKEGQKTPQPKTSQQKTQKTPQTKTPQSPKDIESIKQALLKSPAMPKKFEKFQNVMRSSYKITDKETVKEVWDFLQKNKK